MGLNGTYVLVLTRVMHQFLYGFKIPAEKLSRNFLGTKIFMQYMRFRAKAVMFLFFLCSGCVGLKDFVDPENSAQAVEARRLNEENRRQKEDSERQEAEDRIENIKRQQERNAKILEWRSRDHAAITTRLGYVSGALVCPDYEIFQIVYRAYLAAANDELQDSVTNGQSRQLRQSRESPVPENYGCVLIPTGTRVIVKQGAYLPIVSATIRGKKIVGVTNPGMIRYEESPPN